MDVDRLVSCLVAHLDTVEQDASDDATLTGLIRTAGSEYIYYARCACSWEMRGRRSYVRLYAAKHVRFEHPDEAAAEAVRERLGLVRASRDLIALHQPTSGMGYLDGGGYDDMDPVCTTCGTSSEYGVEWPCDTLRVVARGWGVGTDDKEGGH